MRKKTRNIGIIIAALFLASNLLISWPLINLYNDYLLTRFLTSLENSSLPHNDKVVDSFKLFQIIWGGSNHCDCEVGAMIESDMKIKEFENYEYNPLRS